MFNFTVASSYIHVQAGVSQTEKHTVVACEVVKGTATKNGHLTEADGNISLWGASHLILWAHSPFSSQIGLYPSKQSQFGQY